MPNKKHDALRAKNAAELTEEETRLRKELFDLEFKHSTRQLNDTMAIRRARRQIARVVTFQHQLTATSATATKAKS
ncbi:MAG TPA: 50S ribosomal protein L29 [Myxococcota bacterium]